jgi:hypothetical protein
VTEQLLVRLPEALIRRFKRAVAPRRRSSFIAALLEEALPPDDAGDNDPLYQAALAVEQDEALAAEMDEWETATIGDGLAHDPSERTAR